ncbi:unnamed protein product [Symbiodinium sp. CCMP2592]|nr:unnamed protein product [Symbiodinium sp. CCMP2592]
MLVHLGFPGCCADWLSQQHRWLSWRSAVSEHAAWAGSSLPQGDALSPVGMIAYMSAVAKALTRVHPSVHRSFYLDDRNLAGRDAGEVLDAVSFAEGWSGRLGLQENYAKLKVVARDPAQRPQAEAQSVRVALEYASRLVLSRLFRHHKRLLFRQIVVPKFCFGWLTFHTLGRESSAFWTKFRRAAECHRQAAVPLLRLLEGHFSDCRFTAGQQAFSALWWVASRGFLQYWRPVAEGFTWQGRIRSFLCSLGWAETGPWSWHHHALGALHFGQRSVRDRRRGLHLLRESWRRSQLRTRRDSIGLRAHLQYDELQVKATSRFYHSSPNTSKTSDFLLNSLRPTWYSSMPKFWESTSVVASELGTLLLN